MIVMQKIILYKNSTYLAENQFYGNKINKFAYSRTQFLLWAQKEASQ